MRETLNLISDALENVMRQTQPVGLAQKKSDYTLLALGTAALVLGFYVGFARPSDTVLVFALLGGSVVLFVAALSRLLKRLGYRVVIVSSAEVRPAASAVTRPVAKREIRPNSTGSVADLMNTRLGDLFGADRIDDPEAAGRIVVQRSSALKRRSRLRRLTIRPPNVSLRLKRSTKNRTICLPLCHPLIAPVLTVQLLRN